MHFMIHFPGNIAIVGSDSALHMSVRDHSRRDRVMEEHGFEQALPSAVERWARR